MCTVSVIAIDDGYRLVHSRDEQRSRAPGLVPEIREAGPYQAVAPHDPDGGGTWVLGRDDGLTLAIMNVNPEPVPVLDRADLRSRGLIIPDLAALPADEIPGAVARLDAGLYAPFRLVMALKSLDQFRVTSWTWRRGTQIEVDSPATPVCWPSSGLGDSVVADRSPLFDEIVGADPTPAAQDGYHRHRWPGRGAASVLMSRADALTVSITTVEAGPGGVRMAYSAVGAERAVGEPGEVIEPGVIAVP